MRIDRRHFVGLMLSAPLARGAFGAEAALEKDLWQRGQLSIAVYEDFSPFSLPEGKGIDAEIGTALARELGLPPRVNAYKAGEDMKDDLRVMLWKGHYLGTQPSDVMMHVPIDERLAKENDQVRIMAPYYRETIVVVRNPTRITKPTSGSAANALEIYTREKIGVEGDTLADAFLLGVLNGRLRDNVVHFKSVAQACQALLAGEVAAVMAPRSEVEAGLNREQRGNFIIEPVQLGELKVNHWTLGVAVRTDAPLLAQAVEKAMSTLRDKGAISQIFSRHGITYEPA